MKNTKTIEQILLFATVFIIIVLVAGLFPSTIYGNQETKKSWLEQFENGPVTVTFITAPPEKKRIIDARLISVETCGLVLRLPKDRNKFFPYANIISVDPK